MRGVAEELFYNAGMQPEDLWRELGAYLLVRRTWRKWQPIDIERNGGPSYKTVQSIDRGLVKTVQSVEQYATALDLNLVDILAEILRATRVPITAEVAQVVRIFEQTTVDGRSAILAMMRVLPKASEEPPATA